MPVIIGAKRKLRADARKEVINNKIRNKIKSTLKSFKKKPSEATLSAVFSALDAAAKKKVIPKNRADRKKSRLSLGFAKIGKTNVKAATKEKTQTKKSRTAKK